MHTGGEPLRIITSGLPDLKGSTILEKRVYAKQHLDHYRRLLMNEPRGHKDMYGAILFQEKPNEFGVLFLNNEAIVLCVDMVSLHLVVMAGNFLSQKNLGKKVLIDVAYGGAFYAIISDKDVDRSPTGSGVTARMALQWKKGFISKNEIKEFKSVIGSTFTGRIIDETTVGDFPAVIVEVSGMAYHTGDHTFYLEYRDELKEGFQLPR
ncbi:Trans-L-3-hydroxyproline dehydratase like protein [Argiope bruennichi]|uniref:trans-L-3-hydroxyproline dehydratase n=1 Tax=Argiope bruennichi TaxID=94029 RepID=A0A8T0G2R2_ARGBR|nr:Trans-L-3-hydroxyproline dehydratase like protein [Argiope bruennichi]